MTILDKKLRVEFNSHGGVIIHINKYVIWNTLDYNWRITQVNEFSKESFKTPAEAYMFMEDKKK